MSFYVGQIDGQYAHFWKLIEGCQKDFDIFEHWSITLHHNVQMQNLIGIIFQQIFHYRNMQNIYIFLKLVSIKRSRPMLNNKI